MCAPEALVGFALGLEPFTIPRAVHQGFAAEKSAEIGVAFVHSFMGSLGHHREQGGERRAGVRDGAVLEILTGHALLGFRDIVNAVHKRGRVLLLGTQKLLVKDAGRVIENAAEKGADEFIRDPIAQAAREDTAAFVLEIFERLRCPSPIRNAGRAFAGVHASPNFRDKQADIMIHAHVGPTNPADVENPPKPVSI